MSVDVAEVLLDGPWQHRFVAANGARFHVAELGTGPVVVLLHGFPQFWWTWRQQITDLAEQGYRVVAMDLRGYGASDKPPRGYEAQTLTSDVAGVVRALGENSATVVGHDWGGWVAWAMPLFQPRITKAVGVVSMAHPLAMRTWLGRGRSWRTTTALLRYQVPWLPDHRLRAGTAVAEMLRRYRVCGTYDAEQIRHYQRAMQLPFVCNTSLEYFRNAVRSLGRRDDRHFTDVMEQAITVPVLQLHGLSDRWVNAAAARQSHRWVPDSYTYREIPDAGHFLPEEQPDTVSAELTDWLRKVG